MPKLTFLSELHLLEVNLRHSQCLYAPPGQYHPHPLLKPNEVHPQVRNVGFRISAKTKNTVAHNANPMAEYKDNEFQTTLIFTKETT